MKLRAVHLAECSVLLVAISTSSLCRADGDNAHGLSYRESARGLGIATAGVGLSARRSIGPDVPIATADLVVEDVPAGATVQLAYLYWINFGAGDATVTLDGDDISGSLVGTSDHICWAEPWAAGAMNRVYRADVTDIVASNGSYTITGFPSGDTAVTGETQGAGLVVVFNDPADDASREILLHDGAGTINPAWSFNADLTAPAPGELVAAQLLVGVGDGQLDLADGQMSIRGQPIPQPDGGYWKGELGTYWDTHVLDVTSNIQLDGKINRVHYSYFNDCVAFAYHALLVTTAGGTDPMGGAGAGGMPTGAGGIPTGAGGEGEPSSGGSGAEPTGDAGQPALGGSRSGVGGEADATENGGATSGAEGGQVGSGSRANSKDDGGCGCRVPPPAPLNAGGAAAFALALAALTRRVRRRR